MLKGKKEAFQSTKSVSRYQKAIMDCVYKEEGIECLPFHSLPSIG